MKIILDEKILKKYPNTAIGYLIAEVTVKQSDLYVENLKTELRKHLEDEGINPTTFVLHPDLKVWREIYEKDFGVKAKTFRSSIEALLKRVLTGKEIWNINSIVDLYNCCSVLSLLPMGGYDLDKIMGDIQVRYGQENERFLGLGTKEETEVKSNHVVYSDQQRIFCWLWNHKDAHETCIDENSKRVIFFIDSFDSERADKSLEMVEKHFYNVHCQPITKGVLNKSCSQVEVN